MKLEINSLPMVRKAILVLKAVPGVDGYRTKTLHGGERMDMKRLKKKLSMKRMQRA